MEHRLTKEQLVGMSSCQESNLKHIKEDMSLLLDNKYRKGAEEHGGDMLDISSQVLLDNAIDEAIDQVTYLLTLRYKLFGRPKLEV